MAHAVIERGDDAQVEGWVQACAGHPDGERHQRELHLREVDGRGCRIWLCRERAGAGKAQLGHYQRLLRGWEVDGEPETGKKSTRWGPAVI